MNSETSNPRTVKPLRRRSRSRARFALSLGGLFFCLMFSLLGILAARPFVLANRMRAANDLLERRILLYKQQNQRAKLLEHSFSTEAGIERAARELGYVRPGEMKLRLP